MRGILHELLSRRHPAGVASLGYEVWAAEEVGGPLYCRAGGLTRRDALATAELCRRGPAGGEVVVLDEGGAVVASPSPRLTRAA